MSFDRDNSATNDYGSNSNLQFMFSAYTRSPTSMKFWLQEWQWGEVGLYVYRFICNYIQYYYYYQAVFNMPFCES